MKILFMGTPDFARGVLESLIESEHEVVGVVTQPDRPKGRSDKMIASPVKELALVNNIEVFQPERIKNEDAVKKLKEFDADIFVVAAFGQILSKEILDMPKYGCINVHASLLPKYRGAAPIQWAIADGLKETGVTIMNMNEGLDTGDIISQRSVVISDEETGESLFDKLMECGKQLLIDTLPLIENSSVKPIKQDDSIATYAKILKKEMGYIDFSKSAVSIERLTRAFTPWPGTYTYLNGKAFKLKKVRVFDGEVSTDSIDMAIGSIVHVLKDSIVVKCQEGYLELYEVQLEGKKAMNVHDFLLGYKLEIGIVLSK